MNELFVYAQINTKFPSKKLSDSKDNLKKSMLFSARMEFDSSKTVEVLIKQLSSHYSVKFLLQKINNGEHMYKVDVSKEELLAKAAELVVSLSGDYITEVDLFTAYLELSEEKTHFLEKADLKISDLHTILYWTRTKFLIDQRSPLHIHFHGVGLGEFLVYGWNYEVKKYAVDFTSQVFIQQYPPDIVRRQKEYNLLLDFLAKEKGNNVVLIGELGLGKTNLVEYFTYNSYIKDVPVNLASRRVFELKVERLLAGSATQGDLEERLNSLLIELTHAQNVILFIHNIANIFGASSYKLDLSGVLFDYLRNGKIQIIGTATPSDYKKYLEGKESIAGLFETIRFTEPEKDDALFMLFQKVPQIEHEYNVHFTYKAIYASVDLSSSYIVDKVLPGKALSLLEDAAAEAKNNGIRLINKDVVIKKVEEKTKIILASPTDDEKRILLQLEGEMHKRIIGQDEAVNAVSSAIKRVRSGFVEKKRPISVLLFLGPTGVGKTETAKTLSSLYFGNEKKMIRVDMSEYQTQDSIKRFLGTMPGEEVERSAFLDTVRENPFSLILLDEFEKAHPKILDIFLQVFDDGRLTDNRGSVVSFINTIIIATSNAGSEFVREGLQSSEDLSQLKNDLLEKLQKDAIFKPELLNRFDEVVVFKPLNELEIEQIGKLILENELRLLEEQQIFITFDEKVLRKIATDGFSIVYGARNVRRYITHEIVDLLSNQILLGNLRKGERKKLTVDEMNKIVVI